jgi:hypothetical protein
MPRAFWLAAMVAMLGFSGSSAQAQGFGPGCGGYGWGAPYSYYQRETIPYFSLHPPVYYSKVVPRTYGYSPFAYPPGTMTPEVQEDKSITLQNPYVKPEEVKAEKTSVKKSAIDGGSAMIQNPFVLPAQRLVRE